MAKVNIDMMKKIEKERNSVHTAVDATYTVFDHLGERYFQIDTYGKSDRDIPDKISQSFQIDETNAKLLVKLLINVFGMLE